MSYSFSVKAATKVEAKEAVAKYFDEMVIPHQPVHKHDRAAVLANASAVIDFLADDDAKDIQCSCNGYVSGNWTFPDPSAPLFSGVSIAASASHVNRA